MQAVELVLPAIATAALGTALLVPLRDDRRGRRTTFASGTSPFRPKFGDRTPAETSLAAESKAAILDPFSFVKALMQPLHEFKESFARRLSSDKNAAPETPAGESGGDAVVIERSFANELASLLARDPEPEPVTLRKPDDAADPVTASEPEIIVRASALASERAVPLTRLPLRSCGVGITWTQHAPAGALDEDPSRVQRHALLERCVRSANTLPGTLLQQTYREEDGEGKIIALRAIVRHHALAGRAIFVEALRVGSDDERALAVDGLGSIAARDELTVAFGDRVDAVAARAALAYAGMGTRDAYRGVLERYIDDARIERILTLLAGVIE